MPAVLCRCTCSNSILTQSVTVQAYRSEHMMAVVSKQLIIALYGKPAKHSFWNGCSTGGRQGLMMAQRFPNDYDGILAGAPAIHWDKFQAYQIWPQMVMKHETGGFIASSKQQAAADVAVATCDGLGPIFLFSFQFASISYVCVCVRERWGCGR
eukprot:SAG31_NODE_1709_length_7476_cov_25.181254_4_plen_154_part_00